MCGATSPPASSLVHVIEPWAAKVGRELQSRPAVTTSVHFTGYQLAFMLTAPPGPMTGTHDNTGITLPLQRHGS